MHQSLPVMDEASSAFYQLFADYLQRVTETYCFSEAAVGHTTPDRAGVESNQPSWVQIRLRQIQDWKHHYELEDQAIQRLKANHQTPLARIDSTSIAQRNAVPSESSPELALVAEFYEAKRRLIRQAHQHELTRLGTSW